MTVSRVRKVVRGAVQTIVCATVLMSGAKRALGQDAAPESAAAVLTEIKIIERVTASVDRALEYIASKQRPDGAWADNNAVNGLALLAFMGRGHTPGRGPYKDVIERGKRFLLASEKDRDKEHKGYLGKHSMYEHGLATLALAEMYGMDPDPEVEEKLRQAVELIVRCQSKSGGWRYAPRPGDQDLSVTVMQIMALRAANNAEIPVPGDTIKKAIEYVHSCADSKGGYSYESRGGANPQASAAGILSLQLLGQYNDPTIPKALDYLAAIPVKWGGLRFFYYFHYYAIQAQYQAGGGNWNEWHPQVRELLLEKQNANGSWDLPPESGEDEGKVGPNKIYYTAMASLVLEIYTHFLPAYQR